MFDKPIIIYSDYCVYSKNFIQTLMKYPDLFNSFIRMNIDVNITTKKRPMAFYQLQETLGIKISKVPTLITPNAEHILSDVDAFKWLEYQIKLLTDTSEDLQAFNPHEMLSFSDNYSTYGSTNLCDAKEQSFKFLKSENGNIRLTDDNYLNTSKGWDPNQANKTNGFLNDLESNTPNLDLNMKQNERQFLDGQNSINSSRGQIPKAPPKQINFMDSNNFGFPNQTNNKMSLKSKEMDMKLQQMMQDRDRIDSDLNKRPRFY